MPGALLNNTLSHLADGVTEQYQEGRYETQVGGMLNCIPSITRGILRRNPVQSIGSLSSPEMPTNIIGTVDLSDSFVYSYDRGTEDEQYFIVIPGDGYMHVCNANTGDHLYTNPTKSDYLTKPPYTDAKEVFKAITIGDHTFIVNTTIKTAFTEEVASSDGFANMALYWIKKTTAVTAEQFQDDTSVGILSLGYDYKLNGMSVRGEKDTRTGYTDPELDTANSIAAKFITDTAESLVDQVSNSVAYNDNFTHTDFSWSDSFGDAASLGVWKTIDDADDLPVNLPQDLDGFIVQVSGGTSVEFDDFYLQYDYGSKNWTEVPKPGVQTTLDASTMPHVLYRTDLNPQTGLNFEFGEFRKVLPVFDAGDVNAIAASTAASLAAEEAQATADASQFEVDEAEADIDALSVLYDEAVAARILADELVAAAYNPVFDGSNAYIYTAYPAYLALTVLADAALATELAALASLVAAQALLPDLITTAENDQIDADIAQAAADVAQAAALAAQAAEDTWLGESAWGKRGAGGGGDLDDPSFIGKAISGIFFHKNRLGFLTGDSMVLSITSDYGNFFFQTVQNVLDDDPIDLAIASTDVNILRHAVSTAGTLLIFSDTTQYSLSAVNNGPLTPSSSTLVALSNYTYSNNAAAKAIANKVYFTNTVGNYSQVYTYRVTNLTDGQSEAHPMTTHLPTYISKDLEYLIGHDVLGYTFIKEKNSAANEIVVLTTTSTGTDDVQNAWHRWSFAKDFTSIHIIKNDLYIVFSDGDLGLVSLEIPGSIDEIVYEDVFSLGITANYKSEILFSEFFVRDAKGKGTVRGRYQLRTIQYTIDEDSFYKTTIANLNNSILNSNTMYGPKWNDVDTWNDDLIWADIDPYYERAYTNDDKVTIMGNSKTTTLRFSEDGENPTKGFELATVNVEGLMHQRSTRR